MGKRVWLATGDLVFRATVRAFGPHVRADLLRAARERGAVAVPNSQVEEALRAFFRPQ